MEAVKFEASVREKTGTGSARDARRNAQIPAVVYGGADKPAHIALPKKEFSLFTNKLGFKSTVLEITFGGKTVKAITKDLQVHPITDEVQHVDLQVIEGKESRLWIPVNFINREKSPGIKRGGILNIVRREIEFFADPNNIPNIITIDLTGREIGDSVHVEDLNIGEALKPVLKHNFTVATLVGKGGKTEAEEEEEAAAEAAAAESAAAAGAEGDKKPSAEGEKKPEAKKD